MTTDTDRYRAWLYDRAIGWLSRNHNCTWFEFDDEYVADPGRPVLGARFEDNLRDRIAANVRLPPWFSNLLPEGLLRNWIALQRGVSPDRELDLLAEVGADLSGAITVAAPGRRPEFESVVPEEIGDKESAERRWGFALAGVGLKFSMLRSGDRFTCTATGIGGDWIVKLPDSQHPDVPRNEYTMMRLAAAVGIEVPEVALVHRDEIVGLPDSAWRRREEYAYAVRRFDRVDGERVHIEDFAQLAGVYAERKYEGNYETIASLVYRQHDVDALAEFVRRLTFFVLVGNGDAHLKNWSLIYRDRRVPTLSPAYDIVATEPYSPRPGEETLALKFAGSRRFESVRIHQFQRLSRRLRAAVGLAQVAEDVVRRAVHEWPRFAAELEGVPLLGASVTRTIAQRSSSLLGPDRS
ncbi:MAG TPA: type II toxin-antitoxin system HipA family toxin [Aldersonia sp.]